MITNLICGHPKNKSFSKDSLPKALAAELDRFF
jgi:hypothetical protein